MSEIHAQPRVDFETLSALAQTDPTSFEALRAQTIDAAIARAPAASRLRLRRLQWRIDRVREHARTPLAACIRISDMMWHSFNDLNRLYQYLDETVQDTQTCASFESRFPRARVLQFTPRAPR